MCALQSLLRAGGNLICPGFSCRQMHVLENCLILWVSMEKKKPKVTSIRTVSAPILFHRDFCPLLWHVLQKSSECLDLAKANQQVPSPQSRVFSLMVSFLFALRPLHTRGDPIPISCAKSHLAPLSSYLSGLMSFSWAESVSTSWVVSPVLCLERQSGGDVTAFPLPLSSSLLSLLFSCSFLMA